MDEKNYPHSAFSYFPELKARRIFTRGDVVTEADLITIASSTGSGKDPALPVPESRASWKRLGKLVEIGGVGPWNHNPGVISPRRRIKSDPSLEAVIAQTTDPENLEKFYVPSSKGSSVRCADGRFDKEAKVRADKGLPIESHDLGPQYFGGSAAAALIHRIVDGESMDSNATFVDDIKEIIRVHERMSPPVHFGGHIDDKNHGHPENTGCGAIDRITDIFKVMLDERFQKQFHRLIDAILPDEYQPRIVSAITDQLGVLQKREQQYFEVDQETGVPKYKAAVVSTLQENALHEDHRPVAEMVGEHHECVLVVNKVHGTTFDRDRFNATTGDKVQIFNYDLWGKIGMAKTLYPNDREKQHKYLICSLMFAMAAMMVMTDGSLEVLVR